MIESRACAIQELRPAPTRSRNARHEHRVIGCRHGGDAGADHDARAEVAQQLTGDRHGDVVRANRVDHDPRLGSEADGAPSGALPQPAGPPPPGAPRTCPAGRPPHRVPGRPAARTPGPATSGPVSACPTVVTDTPSSPASRGCVIPAARLRDESADDSDPRGAPWPIPPAADPVATRRRAVRLTPSVSVPSVSSERSAPRHVSVE